ncbi:MAG: hypothetical protein JY451_01710 [Erythrobacter sp.]|nr:MAG: hypothetical protein JY451_01710 [Erythrobacter sp.]
MSLGHTGIGGGFGAGREQTVATALLFCVFLPPVELLEQFTAAPDRPSLNAVGVAENAGPTGGILAAKAHRDRFFPP